MTRTAIALLACFACAVFLFQPCYSQALDKIVTTDYKVIECKIIRVTDTNVEFDPKGDKPFQMIERRQVAKIIYADGTEVSMVGAPEVQGDSPSDLTDSLESQLYTLENLARGFNMRHLTIYITDPEGAFAYTISDKSEPRQISGNWAAEKFGDNGKAFRTEVGEFLKSDSILTFYRMNPDNHDAKATNVTFNKVARDNGLSRITESMQSVGKSYIDTVGFLVIGLVNGLDVVNKNRGYFYSSTPTFSLSLHRSSEGSTEYWRSSIDLPLRQWEPYRSSEGKDLLIRSMRLDYVVNGNPLHIYIFAEGWYGNKKKEEFYSIRYDVFALMLNGNAVASQSVENDILGLVDRTLGYPGGKNADIWDLNLDKVRGRAEELVRAKTLEGTKGAVGQTNPQPETELGTLRVIFDRQAETGIKRFVFTVGNPEAYSLETKLKYRGDETSLWVSGVPGEEHITNSKEVFAGTYENVVISLFKDEGGARLRLMDQLVIEKLTVRPGIMTTVHVKMDPSYKTLKLISNE